MSIMGKAAPLNPDEDKGPPQLVIGGGEVPTEQARKNSQGGRGGGGLSFAQREILAVIRLKGSIRAVEAGRIVHAHRHPPCLGQRRKPPSATGDRYKGGGKGCCAFASTDGSSALKRLGERGIIKQREDRAWVRAEADEP